MTKEEFKEIAFKTLRELAATYKKFNPDGNYLDMSIHISDGYMDIGNEPELFITDRPTYIHFYAVDDKALLNLARGIHESDVGLENCK